MPQRNDFRGQADAGGPAKRHHAVVVGEGFVVLPEVCKAIKVLTDGDVEIRDLAGTEITYPCLAGEVLPVCAVAIGPATTATIVGWAG